jgi:hypothetical protein
LYLAKFTAKRNLTLCAHLERCATMKVASARQMIANQRKAACRVYLIYFKLRFLFNFTFLNTRLRLRFASLPARLAVIILTAECRLSKIYPYFTHKLICLFTAFNCMGNQ